MDKILTTEIKFAKPSTMAIGEGQKQSNKPSIPAMTIEAITNLDNKKGASLHAIVKYIKATYGETDGGRLESSVKRYIKRAMDEGKLVNKTGHGLNGSFVIMKKFQSKEAPKKAPKPLSPKGSALAIGKEAKDLEDEPKLVAIKVKTADKGKRPAIPKKVLKAAPKMKGIKKAVLTKTAKGEGMLAKDPKKKEEKKEEKDEENKKPEKSENPKKEQKKLEKKEKKEVETKPTKEKLVKEKKDPKEKKEKNDQKEVKVQKEKKEKKKEQKIKMDAEATTTMENEM